MKTISNFRELYYTFNAIKNIVLKTITDEIEQITTILEET